MRSMPATDHQLINNQSLHPAAGGTHWPVGWRAGAWVREMLHQTSWRQWVLLAAAVLVPLAVAAVFAVHQRWQVLSEARENAKRSVVALEQHAANAVDVHTLIL